jgi:hypothetical protein
MLQTIWSGCRWRSVSASVEAAPVSQTTVSQLAVCSGVNPSWAATPSTSGTVPNA